MYQWNRASTGSGAAGSRTIAQRVAAAEAGEEGENILGPFRFRKREPLELAQAMRRIECEVEAFPYPATLPESRLNSEIGLYDTDLTDWPAEAAIGPRKPRTPRGPVFAAFPVNRWLPSRQIHQRIAMPLAQGTQIARLINARTRVARSKFERPLSFPAKAILGRMRSLLRVSEMDPLPPLVVNLREKAAAAARLAPGVNDPPSSQLMRLMQPDPATRPVLTRQSKGRESVQWTTKKVVDLDGIGQRLIDAQMVSARFPGVESWRPGPVRARIEPRVANAAIDPARRKPEAFSDLKSKPLAGVALPESRLSGRAAQLSTIAGRLEIELVCPPVLARGLSERRTLEAVLEPGTGNPRVSVPQSRPALARPALGASFLLRGTGGEIAEQPRQLRGLDLSLLDWEIQIDPVTPALVARQRKVRKSFESAEEMVAIPMAPLPPAAQAVVKQELSLLADGGQPPQASKPAFCWRRRLSPPIAKAQSRLEPRDAIAFAGSSFTVGEMAPLSSEASRVVPKLKLKLIEDQAVADAVQHYKETSGRSWFSRLLPSARKPKEKRSAAASRISPSAFGPPRLKWALAALPAALLIGYFLLQSAKSKGAIGSDPAPVEMAQAPAPKSSGPAATPSTGRRAKPKPTRAAAPKEPVTVLPAAGAAQPEQGGVLAELRRAILKRAAVSLSDDFRSGLGDWQGYGEWSKQWSYDAATFLNTGPSVVLYTPSLALSNYRVDFLGQIEKKSLGWVFRAKDGSNYHAAKITLTRGGPLPRAIIEHYTVINGREDRHQSRPLPLEIRSDTLYRVGMDVQDSNFTLSVQGQIVDHWSDNRLTSGGIGFFSARGEQSRLRWVEVSHQYDTLGKLCAFLAPYSLPAREGNQK